MGFVTWGSGSVADASASTSKFFDGSDIDDVKNAELTATLKQADTTTDPEKRKESYSKALRQIADQAYWVPLWTYTTNYVMAKDLNFTPTPDEFVRFYDMNWN
jgi:peptide/nickel transport system substrate-binding protein